MDVERSKVGVIKEKSQVEIELDAIMSSSTRMESLITEIEKRLSIVLQNSIPQNDCEKEEKSCTVPLASEMRDTNERLCMSINQIESIISRLGI